MNTEEIGKQLIEPNFDLGTDYAELALDEFFDEGLLKEVPVVKTLVALVKTGIAIKERFFIKKFLVFLREFHLGSEDKEELQEFKKKFDEDKKYREKITEQILVIVEQLDSVQKAKISAHLFRAYIEKKYDWERFVALNTCLKNLQEITYSVLRILSENSFSNMNTTPTITELKKSLDPKTGAINFSSQHREFQALLMSAGIASMNGTFFSVTLLGQDLYNHGISKI